MESHGEPFIETNGVEITSRDVEALRAISEHGSMHRAAAELGRSYARIQQRVVELEEAVGPLVTRQRGGADGGGSRLTDGGRTLLARFDRLRAALAGTAAAPEAVLSGEVTAVDGETATVTTAAGSVRTLLVDGEGVGPGDAVQVSLRADAVTLHDPADAPPSGATSARNRFAGDVSDVDRGESVARVRIDIGAEEPLVALVTAESVTRLGLGPGRAVVASFKATATRATPA